MADFVEYKPPSVRCTYEGRAVHITIRVGVLDEDFAFQFDAPNTWSARLLVQAINAQLQKAMETTRRQHYEQGWHDARGRVRGKRMVKRGAFHMVLP